MYSGNSGSSMFAVSGQDTVRGVNVAENEELNFGVRLTDTTSSGSSTTTSIRNKRRD